MFQQAFGFVRPAPISSGPAPLPEGSVPPRARLAPILEALAPNFAAAFPCSERPFSNSAPAAKLRVRFLLTVPSLETFRERLARPGIPSHTPPQASSTKNPSPSRSTRCASRSAHPCSDAAPADPPTTAPRPYTLSI